MVTLKEINQLKKLIPNISIKDANKYLMRTNGNVMGAKALFDKENK